MLSRQRKIPGSALYYPARLPEQRFAWALSLYSGLHYMGDQRYEDLFPEQKEFHIFEKDHFAHLFECSEIAHAALFDSVRSRDAQEDYNSTVRFRFNSIAQACIMNNVPLAIVRPEYADEYGDFQLVIVPGTVYLSDEQIVDLGRNSRKLLWCDNAGTRRMNGTPRSEEEILALLGVSEFGGRVQRLECGELAAPFYRRCRADGEGNRDAFNCSEPERWRLWNEAEKAASRALAGRIASLLDRPFYRIEAAPENLLISAFNCDDGAISLRLVNAVATLQPPSQAGYGADDPVEFPALTEDVRIILQMPRVARVKYAAFPDINGELEFRCDGTQTEIILPAGILTEFMLIIVEK